MTACRTLVHTCANESQTQPLPPCAPAPRHTPTHVPRPCTAPLYRAPVLPQVAFMHKGSAHLAACVACAEGIKPGDPCPTCAAPIERALNVY